jgi:hypothetical protein
MSTLKVAAIQNPSAATAAITLDANGGALIGGQAAYARNLLYNGAMQVAQRSASVASITAGGYYTADRWLFSPVTMGTWTQSVESDSPTGSGFTKSWKVLCTTADAAPASGDALLVQQALEGQDLQRIAKGTASAQQLTVSFWVKSNVTGTYIAELVDSDNTRQVSASYSVSASATWEKKTITFPADTTGVFDNDNAASLRVNFWLGAGTDFTSGTLATTWASTTNADRADGQTNLAAATDNYWQVTGVQLEVGPVATPFEFKSFGQELAECQRYYYRMTSGGANKPVGNAYANSTTSALPFVTFPTTMRTVPTALEQSGTAANYELVRAGSTVVACSSVPTHSVADVWGAYMGWTVASGLTAGEGLLARMDAGYLAWSTEL